MRNEEHREDQLIDLGQASVETKGPAGLVSDHNGGKQIEIGLTDD
ncbi:MAG: benenodin family lasso peptide [Sphingobium sp.]|nr:benenodin family lasso peptide [Sphingobium sp.]